VLVPPELALVAQALPGLPTGAGHGWPAASKRDRGRALSVRASSVATGVLGKGAKRTPRDQPNNRVARPENRPTPLQWLERFRRQCITAECSELRSAQAPRNNSRITKRLCHASDASPPAWRRWRELLISKILVTGWRASKPSLERETSAEAVDGLGVMARMVVVAGPGFDITLLT